VCGRRITHGGNTFGRRQRNSVLESRTHRAYRCPVCSDEEKRQAQLEPTAESVLFMLLPAVCTFWPWLLACS
jgi:hypothetical protein